MDKPDHKDAVDLFIIGGGINGCGIARDAAGRGLRVHLAEMNDLASATSSASTKLFHGGLRYLEYGEVRLVREALIEREVLLKMMPHISWPMRFVIPYHKDMRFDSTTPVSKFLGWVMPWQKGRRPSWLVRLGLFMYDRLGGRQVLPASKGISLKGTSEGAPLQERFEKAYEYSDCWVEDSRLVTLNARDAAQRGAVIDTRTKVIGAEQQEGQWQIRLKDCETGQQRQVAAKLLVNAGGPWVQDIIRNTVRLNASDGIRLVRGSHIVTKRLYDHDKCYFFQGTDGRIIFAIPYESDFTLIGTTDIDHSEPDQKPVCTDEERDYLIRFASGYFRTPITTDDIVWTYSGVRPLFDDGAGSASAATRDYVLKLDESAGAPLLNIFGGKITTYRKLAEAAVEKIRPHFPGLPPKWTAGAHLPGGEFGLDGLEALHEQLQTRYPFLSEAWRTRIVRAYGDECFDLLGDANSARDLGQDFGATLTERELRWLIEHEFARTADDVVWRRSKLGLRLNAGQIDTLDKWMAHHLSEQKEKYAV